ncbi:MAG: cobalt-precorrin-5B (C(1))-methyltransferase, partial [Lachnospiraceae bacterium]|nr:cobalt-precorrin-5B (C(1))-methyltransferase [Lachnospiraceae bacterium]
MSETKEPYVFTTGSCAAAASKAAAFMLISGKKKERIRIETPAGIPFEVKLQNIEIEEGRAFCAVRKGSGEDPDVTAGCLICALAEPSADGKGEVLISGGEGVG